MKTLKTLLLVSMLAAPGLAPAHGDAGQKKVKAEAVRKEQKDWGIAGDAQAVTRTIEIRMSDKMRFTPDLIDVREGETIRLVHRNGGKMLHEFVLGTKASTSRSSSRARRSTSPSASSPRTATLSLRAAPSR